MFEQHSGAEGHADKFVKAKWSDEGGLRHISMFHRDLIICMHKVNLSEDGCTMQVCSEILDVWKGISIGRSVGV